MSNYIITIIFIQQPSESGYLERRLFKRYINESLTAQKE
ncbi:hypothetical protein PROCH_0801 [Prochlorococcus marinus str. EQPAC1]|nr:hypothetical protein PROCH_0801 [Prochlorococcus marinus str. EQPAC1]